MKEFKFKIGGQDYAATVEDLKDGQMKVTVNGQTYQVEVPQTKAQGPRVAMAPAAPEAQKGGTKNVNSELPGTVTKIKRSACKAWRCAARSRGYEDGQRHCERSGRNR